MNKIIFLDIDGVMNTPVYIKHTVEVLKRVNGFTYEESKFHTSDEYGEIFDPIAVDALKCIIDSTKAGIVITSSWKKGKSLEYFQKMWSDRNLPGQVVGLTKSIGNRKEEIEDYLLDHLEIRNHVIIDDRNLKMDNQILVDSDYGLTCNDIMKTIAIINK